MKKNRKICCITGSRAEYSRVKSVFQHIQRNPNLKLQIVCSGTHLLDRYGTTKEDIINDGFNIDYECYVIVEGETPVTMSKSLGLAIIEFSTALSNLKPDILLVVGDRFEAVSAALAGAIMNIPVAHIQGGEVSGSIDESFRHVITKLSHIHFPATELSRKRIIAMGEDPKLVFNVGCSAVDRLLEVNILPIEELLDQPSLRSKRINRKFDPQEGYILSVFHPVTTDYELMYRYTEELVSALYELKQNVFWVWPNVDAGSRKIVHAFNHFFLKNPQEHFEYFDHIPFDLFLSLMVNSKVMVGNSSAGIREACYFGIPVVNLGNRQIGREKASSVLDEPDIRKDKIIGAINKQLGGGPYKSEYVYGRGGAGSKIANILAEIEIKDIQKKFMDNFLTDTVDVKINAES